MNITKNTFYFLHNVSDSLFLEHLHSKFANRANFTLKVYFLKKIQTISYTDTKTQTFILFKILAFASFAENGTILLIFMKIFSDLPFKVDSHKILKCKPPHGSVHRCNSRTIMTNNML